MNAGTRATLMLALLAAGCGAPDTSPDTDGTWVGTISTEGNVTTVVNESGSVWAGRPDALRLVLEQTYGVEEDPDEAILGNPAVLRYFGTETGDVYVQDGQRGRLVRFRRDGTVDWVAGSPGRGPGEFLAVTGLALTPDGRSVVVSMFDGHLDYWSTQGVFLRSRPLAPELGIPGVLAGFVGVRRCSGSA